MKLKNESIRGSLRLRERQSRPRRTKRPIESITLQRLITLLDLDDGVRDPRQLETWLRSLRPTIRETAPHIRFNPGGYRRNLVCQREHFEVLILCWATGQQSPIHNHRGSHCGVRVLSGEATEVRFDHLSDGRVQAQTIQTLPAGAVTVSADEDLHVVGNWSHPPRDLITLHVYSPPLTAMQKYADSIVAPAPAHQLKRLDPPRVERSCSINHSAFFQE